jgi:hypothetical protein
MPKTENVIDILQDDDPGARRLISMEELARRWKCTPGFAARRLRQLGIRLVQVRVPLKAHLADVEQLEQALTTYLMPYGQAIDRNAKPHDH